MKAYRFHLDPVLRVRRLQEQVAAQQLALAVRDASSAGAELECARRDLRALPAPQGRTTIDAVRWTQAQSERMSDTADRWAERVEVAEAAAEQARGAWGGARQRTTMLDRLDGRQRAAWQSEFDRREGAEIDDLVTVRWAGEGTRR